MPQASRDYGFKHDGEAWELLKAAGYRDDRGMVWHPEGQSRVHTSREHDAIWYLFEEWDYGYDPDRRE